MGKATVDLPDPLQQPPVSAAAGGDATASADDLLSQLAGDEIDRLLAEAESERPAAPQAATAPDALDTTTETKPEVESEEPPATAVATAPPVQLPSQPVEATLPSADQTTHDTTAAATAAGNEIVSKQLDELFEQLDEKPSQL